jgi:hypothetical protein
LDKPSTVVVGPPDRFLFGAISEEAERSESATLEVQHQTGSKETAIRNNLREARSEEAGKQGR